MSEVILLAGPSLSVARGAEVILDIAPLVIGRPLALVEIERKTLDDADGRGGCWAARWRDGDVDLGDGAMGDSWVATLEAAAG